MSHIEEGNRDGNEWSHDQLLDAWSYVASAGVVEV